MAESSPCLMKQAYQGIYILGCGLKAANMAVLWENAIVHDKGQLPAFTQFYGTDPKYVNNLHPFGKMGISVDPKFKQI